MAHEWQSNAQWPKECYVGMYGDSVSTDTHRDLAGAIAVCVALEKEGFGGDSEYYPIKTWWNKVGDDNPILEQLRADINEARKTIEQLEKDRVVPDEKLKEKFDI